MRGDDGSVSRQGETQGFRQAVHRIGGEHSGTGSAGRTGVHFHFGEQLLIHRVVGTHHHGIDQVVLLSTDFAGLHRAPRYENGRDVQSHGSHQHAWRNFVAIGDANHGIRLVGIDHILHTVGDQIPGRKGIEHSVVTHCNAIVDGNGVELGCKTSLCLNQLFDHLADFVQVCVARNKLGERVDNGNDGFSEMLLLHPIGTPQASGSGHFPPLRRLITS